MAEAVVIRYPKWGRGALRLMLLDGGMDNPYFHLVSCILLRSRTLTRANRT